MVVGDLCFLALFFSVFLPLWGRKLAECCRELACVRYVCDFEPLVEGGDARTSTASMDPQCPPGSAVLSSSAAAGSSLSIAPPPAPVGPGGAGVVTTTCQTTHPVINSTNPPHQSAALPPPAQTAQTKITAEEGNDDNLAVTNQTSILSAVDVYAEEQSSVFRGKRDTSTRTENLLEFSSECGEFHKNVEQAALSVHFVSDCARFLYGRALILQVCCHELLVLFLIKDLLMVGSRDHVVLVC